ncbi:MAG: ABC transporter ATP-binding protein [Chitinophagaceae bacterium]|nr:ABC transporter ATP-binding protein [Chitinophagaceae bacterium]
MNLLQVSAISIKDERDFELKNISFDQQRLQKIAIAGETGSGKSTLLKIIAGLIQPDTGEVWFEGERVKGPYEQLIAGHPKIAYLSQYFELRNNYRVEELLEYANRIYDAGMLYEICDIAHLLKRKTNELSGGEKQRVALARLLSTAPSLLLLDEPFSNLDLIHKNTLKAVIKDIGDALNITCILVSHDPQDILSWADEILVLRNGSLTQRQTPFNMYHYPSDLYTAGLFGKYNLLSFSLLKDLLSFSPPASFTAKNILVRPEHVYITNNPHKGVPGIVSNIFFLGNAIELEVIVNDEKLICRTDAGSSLKKGGQVFVLLDEERIHMVEE